MSTASSMRTTGAPPTVVQRAVHGTKLEQWSEERVSSHWKRNKKAAVDLLELPVAIDRQLEDERLLMEKNRNPQINAPTKMDKVRSEQIIAKVGSTRSVAVKAAVLNKIVREASGVNTYVITAPPRSLEDKPEDISDPDTNPHFKAYAKETKKKPIIVSFGHRPRSASRTFNPATMRFRMRHGEMVKTSSEGQYGFGLPVGVLAKILKAPKISNNGTFGVQGGGDDDVSMEDAAAASRYDPHDLFSLPGSPNGGLEDSVSELQQGTAGAESWVSQTQQSIEQGGKRRSSGRTGAKGGSKKPPAGAAKTTGAEDASDVSIGGESKQYNRDLHELPWDSAHHHVRLTHKELFVLKQNIMPNQPITLPERMARFGAKTIADELTPFCREKQDLDMKILRAGPSAPPPTFKISPPKGLQRMHDPNNLNLNYVKKRREELERKQETAWKAKEFSMDLLSVPKVPYHPESLSLQLQTGVIKLKEIGPIVAEVPALEWEDFRPPSELEVFLQEQVDMRKKIKDEYDAKRDRREQKLGQKTTYGQPRPSLKPLASSSSSSSVSSLALAVPHSSQSLAVSAGSSSMATGIAGVASQTEVDLVNAIKMAKKGNKRALFDLFLGGGSGGGGEGIGIGSLAGSLSSSSNDGAAQVEAWVREREAWESNESESQVAGSLADLLLAPAPRPLTAKEEHRAAEENIEALLAQAAESKRQARAASAAEKDKEKEKEDTEALSQLDKETRDTFEAMDQMRFEEQLSDPQAFVAHVIQRALLRLASE